ncbi:MAG TPA: DUF6655 family protein [Verrucomicrobiae bacterium]
MQTRRFLVLGGNLMLAVWLALGCTTEKNTTPARSATEQLLLSTAADRAARAANLEIFAGRRVFLDTAYFDSYDSKYAIGAVRDALSRAGALLMDNPTNSEIIIEARSGALSMDSADTLFGIPAMAVPIPVTGIVQTPEVAFYKSKTEVSVAKLALLAYARDSRAHIYSSGPLDGSSCDNHYRVIIVSWTHTDVPEKLRRAKDARAVEPWFPQSDLTNLPAANPPPAR